MRGFLYFIVNRLDVFLISQVLDILCFLNLRSSLYRRFCIMLTISKLTHLACLIEFTLKTLKRSVYIFSVFNWYN